MDCVSDAGDVFIGYAATLRWKAFSIGYTSILEQRHGQPTEARTSLLGFSPPEISGSTLKWSSDPLDIKASWHGLSSPITRTIFESKAGDIKWRCIAPIAGAEVQIRDRPLLNGLGYAEQISLSIPPWQLPIDELRWGRFLSDRDSLIWIDWRGPQPFTLVFHNGLPVEKGQVADDEVKTDNCRLVIDEKGRRVLREGPLISTALSMIPGISRAIPRRILNAYEAKWCSRGVMTNTDNTDSVGWVIHEVVRFTRGESLRGR
jgi:hypothetical protein